MSTTRTVTHSGISLVIPPTPQRDLTPREELKSKDEEARLAICELIRRVISEKKGVLDGEAKEALGNLVSERIRIRTLLAIHAPREWGYPATKLKQGGSPRFMSEELPEALAEGNSRSHVPIGVAITLFCESEVNTAMALYDALHSILNGCTFVDAVIRACSEVDAARLREFADLLDYLLKKFEPILALAERQRGFLNRARNLASEDARRFAAAIRWTARDRLLMFTLSFRYKFDVDQKALQLLSEFIDQCDAALLALEDGC